MPASPIYNTGNASDPSLYYQGDAGYTKISNPAQLQELAAAGKVQVGTPYQTLPSDALGGAPAGTAGDTGVAQDTGSTPVAPEAPTTSTYKASDLVKFYSDQKTAMQPAYDAAQAALASASAPVAPDYAAKYADLYSSKVNPVTADYNTARTKYDEIGASLAQIEDDTRNELGGRAAESVVQAEVARRSKPLILQQQALNARMETLDNQRTQAKAEIMDSLGLESQQFKDEVTAYNTKSDVAQKVVDSYNSLLEKGAEATEADKQNFQDLFTKLLTAAPDMFTSLTEDEKAALEQGIIPISVMQKAGQAKMLADLQKKAATAKPFRYGDGSWWIMDANGLPRQILGPNSTPTPTSIVNLATAMYTEHPEVYSSVQAAMGDAKNAMAAMGYGSSTSDNGANSSGPATGSDQIVGDKNYKGYAKDTNWSNAVNKIKTDNGKLTDENLASHLGGGVTPEDISKASSNTGLSWEDLVAVMQHETANWTSNVLKTDNNPGGVLYTGAAGTTKGLARPASEGGNYAHFNTMADGVMAVANTLKNLSDKAGPVENTVSDDTRYAFMDAANNAVGDKRGSKNAADTISKINQQLSSGEIDRAKESLLKVARDNAPLSAATVVESAYNTVQQLQEIKDKIAAAKAAGKDTNLLTGTLEQIANKVGATSDPVLKDIQNRISNVFFSYRKTNTGVAFSPQETAQYLTLFPSIGNTNSLNNVNIDSFVDASNRGVQSFYEQYLGKTNYDKIFGGGTSAPTSGGAIDYSQFEQ